MPGAVPGADWNHCCALCVTCLSHTGMVSGAAYIACMHRHCTCLHAEHASSCCSWVRACVRLASSWSKSLAAPKTWRERWTARGSSLFRPAHSPCDTAPLSDCHPASLNIKYGKQ